MARLLCIPTFIALLALPVTTATAFTITDLGAAQGVQNTIRGIHNSQKYGAANQKKRMSRDVDKLKNLRFKRHQDAQKFMGE